MGMRCLVKFCLTLLGGRRSFRLWFTPGAGGHLSGGQMLTASWSSVSIPGSGVWTARMSVPKVWGSIQQTDTKRHQHSATVTAVGLAFGPCVQETPRTAPLRWVGTRSHRAVKLLLGVISCEYSLWDN